MADITDIVRRLEALEEDKEKHYLMRKIATITEQLDRFRKLDHELSATLTSIDEKIGQLNERLRQFEQNNISAERALLSPLPSLFEQLFSIE
jgi:septation ring formation regulator EzrA